MGVIRRLVRVALRAPDRQRLKLGWRLLVVKLKLGWRLLVVKLKLEFQLVQFQLVQLRLVERQLVGSPSTSVKG